MKVIFLDRDGVINEYPGDFKYVTSWQEFKFLPGAKEALKKLNNAGYKIFILSNQAGVAKGIFTSQALDEITGQMLRALKEAGVEIAAVYYCTHRDEDNCSCRKPKTGLIDMALNSLKLKKTTIKDLESCFLIGDTMRDIQTGKSAGCKTILLYSGKEKPHNKDNWTFQPDFSASDLFAAAKLILKV
jgi:histidinol-phosphate phosphatase family protein